MDPKSRQSVSLEDLIRFKRAERPSPEFWAQFDRELREKQLAALVQKQPWWRALPARFGGFARFHLPLGATAVLAVTLISIRDYEPISPSAGPVVPTLQASRHGGIVISDARAETATVAASEQDEAPDAGNDGDRATVAATRNTPASHSTSGLTNMVALLSSVPAESGLVGLRPSTRSIEENRMVAEALLGTRTVGFEARALPTRTAPQEPLEQLANPSETRRSRFAVAFANANATVDPAPTARVARRLSDEQLYDSIHRFGARGNSVSIKF
ncbi:hypothetical protein DB354_17925 [Opitutus sp. ER46]|nr:hypothetical protein DB354_17925 [Opitutus sp. ER46]